VVVVTYDEADRIESCLDAVFEACRGFDPLEVVVVDSRSTDGTVALAAQYPVGVYRLPSTPDPTPGAGRYVGTACTSGEQILFVDGDAVLEPSWLAAATDRLGDDAGIAGVDGHLNEAGPSAERSVSSLRGVVLYDRSALTSVGGFDPHLQSLEDVELGFRLREAGYRLVRLPDVAATHPFDDGFGELRRRWERGYFHGRGQLLRKGASEPRTLVRTLYYSRLHVAIAAWLLAGVLATGSFGPVGRLAWLSATLAATGLTLQRRGWRWTAGKAAALGPVYAGTVLGALGSHPPPSTYPLADVEVVVPGPRTTEVGGAA
jgi:GT2 family glycosyltransferase